MKFSSVAICLANVYFFFIFAKGDQNHTYTQYEIDSAWRKMFKKETFYKTLDNQLGCWPNNVVIYNILPGFSHDQRKHIMNHIYQIQNRTCVRWMEKRLEPNARKQVEFVHSHFDRFLCRTTETGSSDSPGGIVTEIELGDECFPHESVIHEMLHALGFTHEHSRVDRDCYVTVNETWAASGYNFKIVYDDLTFEKWPYDRRSVIHYFRLPERPFIMDPFYIIKDKDEPFAGILWMHRLGNSHGPWANVQLRSGKLTFLDVYKINYRFCGAPDFCDTQPKMCQDIDEEERWTGCKQIYLDIASGKLVPTN